MSHPIRVPPELLAQLGKLTDAEIARRAGVHTSTVRMLRVRREIAPAPWASVAGEYTVDEASAGPIRRYAFDDEE